MSQLDDVIFAKWFQAVTERFGKRIEDYDPMYELLNEGFRGDTAGFVEASKMVLRECSEFPTINDWIAKKPVQALPSNHASHVMSEREDIVAVPPPPKVRQQMEDLRRSLQQQKAAGAMTSLSGSVQPPLLSQIDERDLELFQEAQLALLSGDHVRARRAEEWMQENAALVATIRAIQDSIHKKQQQRAFDTDALGANGSTGVGEVVG